MISVLTRDSITRFRRIRRAWLALLTFTIAFLVSLGAELWINSRALVVSYQNEIYFPLTHFYPASTFGQEGDSETDYRELQKSFRGTSNWVVMPLVKYNPYENDLSLRGVPPYPPSVAHPLGTDDRGRDILARLVYGFRITVFFALLVAVLSNMLGAFLGSLMGFYGGWFDLFFQRLVELWSTIPKLYLIMILGSIFFPSFSTLVGIMIAFDWMVMTYYFRTEAYREKNKDYALAALSAGNGRLRLLVRHVLPNSMVPLITYFPFAVISAVFALSALDFLGYGLPPPTPSWGEMMRQAFELSNRDKLWMSLSPFFALSSTLMLITLIGEGVREAFDPKAYIRYR